MLKNETLSLQILHKTIGIKCRLQLGVRKNFPDYHFTSLAFHAPIMIKFVRNT